MKKNLIAILGVIFALVSVAFTNVKHDRMGNRFDPPPDGYFTFEGGSGEEEDTDEYVYYGQTAPSTGCGGQGLVCSIFADLDDNDSEVPGNWRPIFTSGTPLTNQMLYETTKQE